jgi:hypothetical protein
LFFWKKKKAKSILQFLRTDKSPNRLQSLQEKLKLLQKDAIKCVYMRGQLSKMCRSHFQSKYTGASLSIGEQITYLKSLIDARVDMSFVSFANSDKLKVFHTTFLAFLTIVTYIIGSDIPI